SLMKELELRDEIISEIDKKKEWDKTLSGGEQQRVAIIGAIIRQPDFLFMDEGTNGLDVETREICERALKKHLKGKTIVAIDHHADGAKKTSYKPFFDYKLKMSKPPEAVNSRGSVLRLNKYQ